MKLLGCGIPVLLTWVAQVNIVRAEPDTEPVPAYVASTRPDRIGRVMAPVYINDRGPFAFVIDTGASRSAISPRTAQLLGLNPDLERPLSLRGVTGQEIVPSLAVDSLRAGDIELTRQRLPVVAPRIFADADGILGIDGFAGMCLSVSFTEQRVRIHKGGCGRATPEWTVIAAKILPNGLVAIRTRIGNRRVQAIIDSGAERSLGNLALVRTLDLGTETRDPATATSVYGATPQTVQGNLIAAPRIRVNDLEIASLPVTFGDFEVFHLWNLVEEPAILLGMDVLGTVDGLMIDYRRSEVRILPHNSSKAPRLRIDDLPTRLP